MWLLLVLAVGAGAYAVAGFVPHREIDHRRVLAALATWLIATLLLQFTIDDGGRGSLVTLLFLLVVAAAIPLGLAVRRHHQTHRRLDQRSRGPVVMALGLLVSASVVGATTIVAGAVAGGSSDSDSSSPSATTSTTLTTLPATTTTSQEDDTTTTEDEATTTTTEPKGPVSVSGGSTFRDSASGALHVVLENFTTTKGSVSVSFGNEAGLLIIFDAGSLGELTNDYHLRTSKSSVKEADVQIAMTQSQEGTVTVYADGTTIATCQPAGTDRGTCEPG